MAGMAEHKPEAKAHTFWDGKMVGGLGSDRVCAGNESGLGHQNPLRSSCPQGSCCPPLGRPHLPASFLTCNQRTPFQISGHWGCL